MSPKKPLKWPTPVALRHHNIKSQTFLNRKKQYTSLAVGAFIFYPPKAEIIPPPPFDFATNKGIASNAALNTPIEPARLLLLQRVNTDHTFTDLWEVPGGGSEVTDRTILHSVANRILEETGLQMKKFLKQVGDGEEFETSEGLCCKLNFEIEVKAIKVGIFTSLGDLEIKLDPDVHRDFVWATEKDIRDEIYPVVRPEQTAIMLHAFQLRTGDEEEMRALAVIKERARKEAHYAVDSGEDDDDDEEIEEAEEEEDE